MDLSKLPKLSETNRPPNAPNQPTTTDPATAQPAVLSYRAADAHSFGPEIWLSAIIGIVFILLGLNFAKYVGARMTGHTYHTGVNWLVGPKEGQEVDYSDLQGFVMLNDSAVFLFGLALVFEAIVLVAITRGTRFAPGLLVIALAVAVLATGYNAFVAILLFTAGALPLMSLLAVAFGGYIAMSEWKLLESLRGPRREVRA